MGGMVSDTMMEAPEKEDDDDDATADWARLTAGFAAMANKSRPDGLGMTSSGRCGAWPCSTPLTNQAARPMYAKSKDPTTHTNIRLRGFFVLPMLLGIGGRISGGFWFKIVDVAHTGFGPQCGAQHLQSIGRLGALAFGAL